jgi:hypothetical protein
VLGWWRWAVAIASIVGAIAHPSRIHGNRLADIGAFAAEEWAKVPGHQVGSSPLDAIANIAAQVGTVPVVGPGIAHLAQLAVALAVVLVAAIVPGWYESWRSLARRVDPGGRSVLHAPKRGGARTRLVDDHAHAAASSAAIGGIAP